MEFGLREGRVGEQWGPWLDEAVLEGLAYVW